MELDCAGLHVTSWLEVKRSYRLACCNSPRTITLDYNMRIVGVGAEARPHATWSVWRGLGSESVAGNLVDTVGSRARVLSACDRRVMKRACQNQGERRSEVDRWHLRVTAFTALGVYISVCLTSPVQD